MSLDLKALQDQCEFDSVPTFKKHLTGGDINEVFLIEADTRFWVVKKNVNSRFPLMLAKEFDALVSLRHGNSGLYPEPIKHFVEGKHQYLVLEYVEKGENTSRGQKNLGTRLAQQHAITSEHFGWKEDNYIGSLHQSNDLRSSWEDFYAENRLLAQTKLAFDKGYMTKQKVSQMEAFCKELASIFPLEPPALLHGDLWGGNYFITTEEKPLLYDPAVYFGHREIDIAMTRFFGGFSQVFYDHYCEVYPLEKGWNDRIPYGQLYPNLVHLNLFGPAYLSAVTSVINRF